MASIPRGNQPTDLDPVMGEYLNRVVTDINLALGQQDKMVRHDVMPTKLAVGKLYYFNRAVSGSPITSEGVWIYKSDQSWQQL